VCVVCVSTCSDDADSFMFDVCFCCCDSFDLFIWLQDCILTLHIRPFRTNNAAESMNNLVKKMAIDGNDFTSTIMSFTRAMERRQLNEGLIQRRREKLYSRWCTSAIALRLNVPAHHLSGRALKELDELHIKQSNNTGGVLVQPRDEMHPNVTSFEVDHVVGFNQPPQPSHVVSVTVFKAAEEGVCDKCDAVGAAGDVNWSMCF